jgi:hypothetical protein
VGPRVFAEVTGIVIERYTGCKDRVFDIDPDSPSVADRSRNAWHGNDHYTHGFCAQERTTVEVGHRVNLAAKVVHRTKSVKIMEVEQHHVLKFFSDEAIPGVQIVTRLR